MIIIRPITKVEEMHAVEALQQEVWGISEREIVSFMMFIPTLAVGGVLLGAFAGAVLVGFSYGFIGHENGRLILHSDMLAVRSEYRDQQLGFRLKLAQREHALAQGIDCISWTFDPLQSRNAHLNFGKLGVTGTAYKVDFYGPSSSPLHQGGTDRLWLNWNLNSPRVLERVQSSKFKVQSSKFKVPSSKFQVTAAPRLVGVADDATPELSLESFAPAPEQLWLEIPLVVAQWQKDNPQLVARWREATRQAFTQAFRRGYFVTDFYRRSFAGAGLGLYLLRRKQIDESK